MSPDYRTSVSECQAALGSEGGGGLSPWRGAIDNEPEPTKGGVKRRARRINLFSIVQSHKRWKQAL